MRMGAIDGTVDDIQRAKDTAIALTNGYTPDIISILDSGNLDEVETGIKTLNEMSDKCWLLSSIVLYTSIYDHSMYQQSGLMWSDYLHQSRERLGLAPRDITEQLSGARFFLKYHKRLADAGWSPAGSARKLARAELALEMSGNIDDTISHLVSDSWREFNAWYSSFKTVQALPKPTEYARDDIEITPDKILVQGIDAVTLNDQLPLADRERFAGYITKIFEAIKNGYEPAIIPVYDANEGKRLEILRDKERAKR